jgi:hypothetical protein
MNGFQAVNGTAPSLARRWADNTVINQLAGERIPDVLRHINTDHTARDMLKITEAHGMEKLQYWGLSYVNILQYPSLARVDDMFCG